MTKEKQREILDNIFAKDEDVINEDNELSEKDAKTVYEPQDALDALDKIASMAYKCELNKTFDDNAAQCLAFMNRHYGFSKIQAVAVALITDSGRAMNSYNISNYLGIRNIQMLRHEKELLELVKKGVLMRVRERDIHGDFANAYNLRSEIKSALCKNERFFGKKLNGLSALEFFKEVDVIFKEQNDDIIDLEELSNRLSELLNENDGLVICRKIKDYGLTEPNIKILLYVANRYVNHDSNSANTDEVSALFDSQLVCRTIRESFINGWNDLLKKGILECESVHGLMDIDDISLTISAKKEMLQGLGLRFTEGKKYLGLKSATDIMAKNLFYNERETESVNELTQLLDEKHFAAIQARLESEGMRKGFACLFYGSAGTGKTETVLQIARQTGRDIMQVDLSTIRDKYVGETEKRVKAIFDSYRTAAQKSGKAPILLLNEADAIICRRSTNTTRSVDKMENAMQNIILQEIENLDGILIATTNLTDNMDNAFSRRFLYKIRFDRPSLKAKTAIWKSMLPRLSEEESAELASSYDLSGGQIENIVRKQTVDYVISGEYASLPKIHDYCKAELAGDYTQKNRIGF